MHENVRKKFFGAILQYLRSCRVDGGQLVGIGDTALLSRILELEEQHLHEWVSEAAVIQEIWDRMTTRLRQTLGPPTPPKASGIKQLEEVLGRDDLEQLVTDIVDFLSSIPYPSTFWAQLRGVKLAIEDPISFGPFRLRVVGKQVASPPRNLLALALVDRRPLPPDLQPDEVVLEIAVKGYSRQRISDSSPVNALSLAKEFIVLTEAVEVFEKREGTPFPQPTPLLCEVLDAEHPVKWVDGIAQNTSRHVDNYELHDAVRSRRRSLLDPIDDQSPPHIDRSEPERVAEVKKRLQGLERVFAPDADKHVNSLRAAAEWYFDSQAESNETTAFLFACLGLEALLGGGKKETESVGLQRLLANRLAYLLGGSRSSREKLIEDFEEFYEKRSALVHGRERRLDRDNKKLLLTGRYWLGLAIQKELRVL